MKQALRLELRNKEKVIREQEQKYLMADFGLGNVVYGWDVTNPAAVTAGTERTQAAATTQGRLATRRKVKDSDRIFSSSSVMSSSAGASKKIRINNFDIYSINSILIRYFIFVMAAVTGVYIFLRVLTPVAGVLTGVDSSDGFSGGY